jgi:F420-dependent oxidoreductase-like protein
MKIGIMLADAGPGGRIEDTLRQVEQIEADGFDNVWFGQIFGADSLTMIALAGPRTSRIAFGTGVLPTYVRHPFAMAQQAMTVNAATGGRLSLGIGPSHAMVVENMWGMSYDKPAKHVREYLSVLCPLVRDGRVAFQGDVFRVAANLQPPEVKPMPVLISALAPAMLKIAGEMTDGTVLWMTGPKTIESHIVPAISKAAQSAGRPQPRVVAGVPVAVTDDADAARARASKVFQIYGQLPNYRRVLDREGIEGPAQLVAVGDEAAVEKRLREIASAGATELMAAPFPVGEDARGSLERTRALLKSLVGKV